MPKKTYKLLRFDGGINNDADSRDIADHQLEHCKNMAVNSMGRLKGNLENVAWVFAGVLVGDGADGAAHAGFLPNLSGVGHGFFAFTADHTGFLDDVIAYPGITYYLAEATDAIVGMGSDGEASETGPVLYTIFAGTCPKPPVFYYVDGALRVGAADHESTRAPVWRGFINEKDLMPGTTNSLETIAEQWYEDTAAINGAFPTFAFEGSVVAKNAMMGNTSYSSTDGAGDSFGFNNEATTPTTDAGAPDAYTGTTANDTSDCNWGLFLDFYEDGGDGTEVANGTGTWMPKNTTRYKFYITTMYDDHTQESLPQLMRMWDTGQIEGSGFSGKEIKTEIAFMTGDSDTPGENVSVHFTPVWKILHAAGGALTFGAGHQGDDGTSAGELGNPRISGTRIYWASNEDGYTALWQMFDAKWDEGVKLVGMDSGTGGTSGYSPWLDDPANANAYAKPTMAANKWTNPPRYFQYDVLNAHSATDVINVDSFKTAVVANRRTYIGNLRQDGWIYGDRMLKSPVNQFDKFPSINNIDVAIHDGDEIILLLEYADRILQFKQNALYIINVSGNSEYLEAEHKHKGISNPGAACRTDYGVVWANRYGCFFYDGEQVTDLLEDQGQRKLSQACWSQFIGSMGLERVGFQPSTKQIIIKAGTTVDSDVLGALRGNEGFFYDMIGKSWVFSSQIVETNTHANGAGFINDPIAGHLLWLEDYYNQISYLKDGHSDNFEDIDVVTKDIDFGEPGVRKKVYKVYVSYRGTGSAIQIHYGVNGDIPDTLAFKDTLNDGTGDYDSTSSATPHPLHDVEAGDDAPWVRAELKPAASINNIYSFQLRFRGGIAYETFFEINDITIVYRAKGIK